LTPTKECSRHPAASNAVLPGRNARDWLIPRDAVFLNHYILPQELDIPMASPQSG